MPVVRNLSYSAAKPACQILKHPPSMVLVQVEPALALVPLPSLRLVRNYSIDVTEAVSLPQACKDLDPRPIPTLPELWMLALGRLDVVLMWRVSHLAVM